MPTQSRKPLAHKGTNSSVYRNELDDSKGSAKADMGSENEGVAAYTKSKSSATSGAKPNFFKPPSTESFSADSPFVLLIKDSEEGRLEVEVSKTKIATRDAAIKPSDEDGFLNPPRDTSNTLDDEDRVMVGSEDTHKIKDSLYTTSSHGLNAPAKHSLPSLKLGPTVSKRAKLNNSTAAPVPTPRGFPESISVSMYYATEPIAADFSEGSDSNPFKNAMVWYWRVTKNLSFGKMAAEFNEKFGSAEKKPVSVEAVRRRYHRMSERLDRLKTMGGGISVVEEDADEEVDTTIVNRDLRGNLDAVEAADEVIITDKDITVPAPAELQAAARIDRKMPNGHQKEKNLIYSWKNSGALDWSQIRDKLEKEFGWSIGTPTVQKYYYQMKNVAESVQNKEQEATQELNKYGITAESLDGLTVGFEAGRKVERRNSI